MSAIVTPATVIDSEVKQSLLSETREEGQVIVHITYHTEGWGEGIRIWPTTYLVPQEGGEKSRLLMAEHISFAPLWTLLHKKEDYRFTLIFSPLPKSCRIFHLWEDIPEPNGFLIRNIPRNDTDVYEVSL